MLIKISNNSVKKLKSKNELYEVRDIELKGFLVRVHPSGVMSYICQYRRGNRVTLGRVGIITAAQAREKALEIINNNIKGLLPAATRGHNRIVTLQEFIDKHYYPWVIVNRKSGRKTVDRIKRCFFKNFSNFKITDITNVIIENWRTTRLNNQISTETINRDVATFRAAISKAVDWNLIAEHPFAKVKLFKTDPCPNVRFLSTIEEKNLRLSLCEREKRIKKERRSANIWREQRGYSLHDCIEEYDFVDHLQPMILISINTGIRKGELFNLTWSMVQLERRILILPGSITKSGYSRHIPLNNESLSVLKKWKLQQKNINENNLVFISKYNKDKAFNNITKSWRNILNDAEIKNFRWHDLRHHFASRLVMAGIDLNIVRELLGHSDMKVTLRYAHLAPECKANAVAVLNNNCFIEHV